MDKSKTVIELALALRFELVSHSNAIPLSSGLESLSAEDREWLGVKSEKLLEQHDGSAISAVSSIALPPAIRDKLIEQLQKTQAGKESTEKTNSQTADQSPDSERTQLYVSESHLQVSSRYLILKKCGSGGLGDVYSAKDRQLNRIVALKKIRTDSIHSESARERFQTEAEITGRLQHPSIAPVYSFELDESGSPYYTMRFIDGESLSQQIEKSHNLSGEKRQSWLRQQIIELVKVFHAIEFAHSQGVIHRDIKPANIMVGKFGESFLVDWGLARSTRKSSKAKNGNEDSVAGSLATQHFSLTNDEDGRLTKIGQVVGTPAFMSPEQTSGDSTLVGFESDVYSLGATLFALVKGQQPFKGYTAKQIISKLSSGETPQPAEDDTRFPNDLRSICRKAMSANPAHRYSSASAFRRDLQNWLDDEPVSVANESTWTKLRRLSRKNFKASFAIASSIVVCLGLLVFGLIVSYAQNKELASLNEQLTNANEIASQSQDVAQENFQHAQDVVGDFLVMVTEHKALKNGPAGVQAFRKKLLEKAQSYYQLFLEDSLSQKGTVVQSVSAFEKLASIQTELGEFEKCLSNCEQAIALLESMPSEAQSIPSLRELKASLLSQQGESQIYLGQSEDARKSYEESISIRKRLLDSGDAPPLTARRLAWTKNSYALLLSNEGELAEADQLFSDTFSQLSENEPQTLWNQKERLQYYLTSSQIKSRRGKRKETTQLLEQGIRLAKDLLEEFPKEYEVMEYLAAFEQDMASEFDSTGQPIFAKPHVEEAIRIRENLNQAGESNFENEWYLANAYRLLANVNCNLRQHDPAIKNAGRAIEKIQHLLVQENKNMKAKVSLATAYRTRGRVLSHMGKAKESFSDHESAINVLREIIEQQGESEELLHSLAQALHNHGMILEKSFPAQAMSRYAEAAEIIERLANQLSPRPKLIEDAVIILGSFGELVASTRSFSEGIQILERRADIAKRGFALTNLERFKDKWVWCMNDVAQNYSQNNQLDKSRKWFDDCQKLWETFSEGYKKTESYAQGYGGTLVNGSMAFRKRKEYQKALDWLDKADSLMKPFAEEKSSGPNIRSFYTFGQKTRARLLGQMASDLAVQADSSQLDKALELLGQAERYDYQNTSNLALKANLHLKMEQTELAIQSLQRLEDLARKANDNRFAGKFWPCRKATTELRKRTPVIKKISWRFNSRGLTSFCPLFRLRLVVGED